MTLVGKVVLSSAAAACCLAVAAFVCMHHSAQLRNQAERPSSRQHEVIAELADALLDQLRTSEAGQQGFIITGDSLYLESYSAAVGQIGLTMQKFYALPQRSTALNMYLGRLDTLLTRKFNEFNTSILLRREKSLIKPAADVIRKTRGRATTDSIRAVIGLLQAEQRSAAAAYYRQTLDECEFWQMASLACGGGALLLMLLLTLVAVQSFVVSLRRLIQSVERFALGDLAHRVPHQKPPEIAALQMALNAMATTLQSQHQNAQAHHNIAVEALNALEQGFLTAKTLHTPRGEVHDFEITLLNLRAAFMLGVPQRQALGQSLLSMIPPQARDTLLSQCTTVVKTGRSMTIRHDFTNNQQEILHMSVTASKFGDGVVLALTQ
jgi:CHASE3 domain sensor protein